MINSLLELNEKVTQFANYIVSTACDETTSGSYSFTVEEICSQCNIEINEYIKYRIFFEEEISSREELLDYTFTDKEIDVTCALNYCSNYEWIEGDEEIFGSYEEFRIRDILPYKEPSEPLCLKQRSNPIDLHSKTIILSPASLTVDELSKDQLTELKHTMYCQDKDTISWAELSNIDILVSDEAVKTYYADTLFAYDDFNCSSKANNFDSMIESAENRKIFNNKEKDDDLSREFGEDI